LFKSSPTGSLQLLSYVPSSLYVLCALVFPLSLGLQNSRTQDTFLSHKPVGLLLQLAGHRFLRSKAGATVSKFCTYSCLFSFWRLLFSYIICVTFLLPGPPTIYFTDSPLSTKKELQTGAFSILLLVFPRFLYSSFPDSDLILIDCSEDPFFFFFFFFLFSDPSPPSF